MRDLDKDDVFYALKKMEMFLSEMSDEEFGKFSSGIPINTMMIPPRFDDFRHQIDGEVKRKFVKLEFRIS